MKYEKKVIESESTNESDKSFGKGKRKRKPKLTYSPPPSVENDSDSYHHSSSEEIWKRPKLEHLNAKHFTVPPGITSVQRQQIIESIRLFCYLNIKILNIIIL